MSVTVHKKSPVKAVPMPEEQGLLLFNNEEEASLSTKSLEKANELNNSTPKQLENIERENRLSAILRLHTRGLNQEQIAQVLRSS
jgi:hypothetical protein